MSHFRHHRDCREDVNTGRPRCHKDCLLSVRSWDKKYLRLARFVANDWSKDPRTQTGAVIAETYTNYPVSIGFNGFARGVDDTPERYANRELKHKMVLHCERNAIIFARRDLSNCTLYTWPLMSCSVCASMVIQAQIKRVVAPFVDDPVVIRDNNFEESLMQFKEAGVLVVFDHEQSIRDQYKTDLYFECHITVEPVFDERLEEFRQIAKQYAFRVADLLMKKRKSDTEERSKNDTFCTGRSASYSDINTRMLALVDKLNESGFKVWRYKIENTLVDMRTKNAEQ